MTVRQRGFLWVVCLILGASYFYGIQSLPLRDYRETTYAEIGREILERDDYLVPHLNGTPHLDKPPMVPWLVALSFDIFGISEGAARLPSVLAILWTALVAGWMTRRIFGRGKGILGAVLFLGMPGMHYHGRMLMTDTVFMAWILTALAAFLEGYLNDHRGWYRFGFFACGMSVLTRGPIGLAYLLGTLLAFFLIADRKAWTGVPWVTGSLLFLIVSVPWFTLMEVEYPGFLHLVLVEHHLNRLLPSASHPFVAEPRWEILLGFAGFLGPITLLLPWAIAKARGERSAHQMMWLFALLVMASVLLSTGRNHPYTFPALPPLAILAAGWLGGVPADASSSSSRLPAFLIGILGITILGVLPWLDEILGKISPLLDEDATYMVVRVCLALVAVLALVGSLFLLHGKGPETCAAIAALMIPGTYMMAYAHQQMAPLNSRALLAGYVKQEVPETWPVIIANPQDHLFEGVGGWCFYAQRYVLMVAFEPPMGPFQGVSRPEWIIDEKDLVDLQSSGNPLALATTSDAVARLPFGPLPSPLAQDERFGLWILSDRHSPEVKQRNNPG